MPRNSLVNGKTAPDSFGTQLDEVAYPILMADQLGLTDATLYSAHIKPAANYLVAHGPAFGSERWEEQSGYSPSTIAAEIAGLVAAADLAKANGDPASAAIWLGVADDMQRSIKAWTVTTNGPLSADPYFIRLSKGGDPNAAITYNVGNGGPTSTSARSSTPASSSSSGWASCRRPTRTWLARWRSSTRRSRRRHRAAPAGIATTATATATAPSDGRPWAPSGKGTGHLWPVLSAERAEQSLATGDTAGATSLLLGMRSFASGVGLIPEQDWERAGSRPRRTAPTRRSPRSASRTACAAGSASPLTWSAASFVRLTADLAAEAQRRAAGGDAGTLRRAQPGGTTLTVTSPLDNASVSGSPVTVTGTTAAGNTVYVAATNTDANSATTVVSTPAAADGSFSVDVPVTGGTSVLNVVAVSPTGGTAHVQRTILFDFVPGTLLLDVPDPDGDDNGPGNYAYPTSSNFHAGAFDIQRFQVYDAGTDVIFRLQTRDLSETFGSPLGAQLVDVYVHVPGGTTTSTAAAHPSATSRSRRRSRGAD